MSYKYLIILINFLFAVSCGLNYIPTETPESQTTNRQIEIQKHLTETLQKDSITYKSLAFAKTKTLKPISYLQLDSLYREKFKLEKQGKRDKKLEEEILIQRQIALNDTNGIIYIENHLFTLTNNKLVTVYSSEMRIDHSNTIKNVKIFETTRVPLEYLELYQIYTFEESFLQPGFGPLPEETKFYLDYKSHAATLSIDAKEKFVQHSLTIMKAGQKVQNFKTVPILSELVRENFHGSNRHNIQNEGFDTMEETYVMKDGKEVFTGYLVNYRFQKEANSTTTSYRYTLKISPFLEILTAGLY